MTGFSEIRWWIMVFISSSHHVPTLKCGGGGRMQTRTAHSAASFNGPVAVEARRLICWLQMT
jgi:hypothetical protein